MSAVSAVAEEGPTCSSRLLLAPSAREVLVLPFRIDRLQAARHLLARRIGDEALQAAHRPLNADHRKAQAKKCLTPSWSYRRDVILKRAEGLARLCLKCEPQGTIVRRPAILALPRRDASDRQGMGLAARFDVLEKVHEIQSLVKAHIAVGEYAHRVGRCGLPTRYRQRPLCHPGLERDDDSRIVRAMAAGCSSVVKLYANLISSHHKGLAAPSYRRRGEMRVRMRAVCLPQFLSPPPPNPPQLRRVNQPEQKWPSGSVVTRRLASPTAR